MAFKDPKKAVEYNTAYNKATYKQVMISLRKDSEEWDALEECKMHTGLAYSTYAHAALVENLQRDGYLPDDK